MALLVPDVGEAALLTRMLATSVVMHLYTNDVTPAEADTAATYTEAVDASYAEATLTGGSWTVGTDGGGTTSGTFAQQDFTFGGASTVYGYFVTDVAGTTLLWAERFSTAASFGAGGGTVSVTPSIELA